MKHEHPLYGTWSSMCQRCHHPRCKAFIDYGARGIVVFSEWRGKGGFDRWLAYMGPRPSPEYSLDRYPNNDGNYEPGNVRWATKIEQMRNRRGNLRLTFQGETLTAAEWSERLGITRATIYQRLDVLGWSTEETLSTPMRANRRREVIQYAPDSEKRCIGCNTPKPRTAFHTDKRASDGRRSRCRVCQGAINAKHVDPVKAKARQAAYRARKRLTAAEFRMVHAASTAVAS